MKHKHFDTLPDVDWQNGIYNDTLHALLRGEPIDLEWTLIGLMVMSMHVRERIRELEREEQRATTLMRDPVQWQAVVPDDERA